MECVNAAVIVVCLQMWEQKYLHPDYFRTLKEVPFASLEQVRVMQPYHRLWGGIITGH